MKLIAKKIFEPLYEFDPTIYVASFYRSTTVNLTAYRCLDDQNHSKGEEIDLSVGPTSKFTNADLFEFAYHNVPYDYLLWACLSHVDTDEVVGLDDLTPPWIHISLKPVKNHNHHIALREYYDNRVRKVKRVYRFTDDELDGGGISLRHIKPTCLK